MDCNLYILNNIILLLYIDIIYIDIFYIYIMIIILFNYLNTLRYLWKEMFFIYDNVTNGLKFDIISLISITSIYSSILVITSKNPVVSVLFLITLFFNIACYLIMIGLNFIGLSYLLIYVGAISILFLFILMLINIRISELLSQTRNSIPLVTIVSCLIYFYIISLLPNKSINATHTDSVYNIFNTVSDNINTTPSFYWDGNITEFNPMGSMGNIMFTTYPLWLLITSIILLLGMAGVIVITIGSNPK